MPDIFFKCGTCGKHLVVDETRAGATVSCPDCNAVIMIPDLLIVQECPHCREVIKAATEVKGELLRCPSCQGVVPLPGQPQSIEEPATVRKWQRV